MNYLIMIQEVDEMALLYRWEQKSATEADACLKPAALPTSLTGLQSYAYDNGGDCWCQLWIGFIKDPNELVLPCPWQKKAPSFLSSSNLLVDLNAE
jgi:hypothetical protein